MALTGTFTLTVDLVDIAGIDTPDVDVVVEKVQARLVYPVGADAGSHETLFPRRLAKKTDSRGVAAFDLLPTYKPGTDPPEPLAGAYRVTIGGYQRTVAMPAEDARLANLPDVDPATSGEADRPTTFLHTDMRNLDADLSDEEKAAIRRKIGVDEGGLAGVAVRAPLAGDGSEENPLDLPDNSITFDELDDGIGAAIRAADNLDAQSRRIAGNANRAWETDGDGAPGWRPKTPVPAKATNTDVDGEAEDTKFMTVTKTFRAIARKVKNASATVRGIVLLARNEDVDASETDTSRVLDVAHAKRLIARLATGITQSAADLRYLLLAGGTMTGPLVLAGAPTLPLHAATKAYVDANVGGGGDRPVPDTYYAGWSDAAVPTDGELGDWQAATSFHVPIPARAEADGNGRVGFAIPADHADPANVHYSNLLTFDVLDTFTQQPNRTLAGEEHKVWTSSRILDRAIYGESGDPVYLLLGF